LRRARVGNIRSGARRDPFAPTAVRPRHPPRSIFHPMHSAAGSAGRFSSTAILHRPWRHSTTHMSRGAFQSVETPDFSNCCRAGASSHRRKYRSLGCPTGIRNELLEVLDRNGIRRHAQTRAMTTNAAAIRTPNRSPPHGPCLNRPAGNTIMVGHVGQSRITVPEQELLRKRVPMLPWPPAHAESSTSGNCHYRNCQYRNCHAHDYWTSDRSPPVPVCVPGTAHSLAA